MMNLFVIFKAHIQAQAQVLRAALLFRSIACALCVWSLAIPGFALAEQAFEHSSEHGTEQGTEQGTEHSPKHSSEQNTQASQKTISSLLAGMSQAIRNLNYQGRFVYSSSGNLSSFELQHAVFNNQEHERLVFLNEKKQEVVRVGHDVFCFHPGNDLLMQHGSISSNPFTSKLTSFNQQIYNTYDLSISANQMVAGRDVYKVDFKSRDGMRYNHSFWIDKEKQLLLKASISDASQGVLESFEFVQIDIEVNIDPSVFEHQGFMRHTPEHISQPTHDHSETSSEHSSKHDSEHTREHGHQHDPSVSPWKGTWLPQGFYYSGTNIIPKQSKEERAEQETVILMYTDGITAVSVFIEPVEEPSNVAERSQIGATSAFSLAKEIEGQHYMITAVGEVNLSAVEGIAQGIDIQQ